jgi:hypothetical protein
LYSAFSDSFCMMTCRAARRGWGTANRRHALGYQNTRQKAKSSPGHGSYTSRASSATNRYHMQEEAVDHPTCGTPCGQTRALHLLPSPHPSLVHGLPAPPPSP